MKNRPLIRVWPLILLLLLPAFACQLFEDEGPPSDARIVEVMANTSVEPWLQTAALDFNDARLETDDGRPVFVQVTPLESGEAILELVAGARTPAMWVPEDQVWAGIAADEGNAHYRDDCISLAESPLVIAMWRSLAESLGWPGRDLGWFDIDSLASDPGTWAYYSGGEFGDTLRLGHTHPGLSGSGASTLLALVQAALAQQTAVDADQIGDPVVRASVSAFESSVATFSSNTADLAASMAQRGPTFLGAAIMYETNVLSQNNADLIPVYPFDGTYVATFPGCIDERLSPGDREAATIFRDYLLDEGQVAAVNAGLRPVNDATPLTAPLIPERGVNLDQPEIIFASPGVAAVYAAQELWQSARKDVNLVMLIDTSGSMEGDKMSAVINAAQQFVEQMGDDDFLTLIAFATEPQVIYRHARMGDARDEIIRTIGALRAEGDTTLFDAIGDGAKIIDSTTSPETTNALVVLTDGRDTRSYRYDFNDRLIDLATANDTTIFTVAYGSDASENILRRLAEQANGNFYLGDEASIATIYEEMSAAFGGSAGIGR